MCDLGRAQNFRVELAKRRCSEAEAFAAAEESTFCRSVVFGLGTTGLFIGDQIRRKHPQAKLLFVARSDDKCEKAAFVKANLQADYLSCGGMSEQETADAIVRRLGGRASVFIATSGTEVESRIAFQHGVLGCNGIYNSFSLGPRVQFDSMPFGFQNQVVFSSINFTQKHMEEAIKLLCDSSFDALVHLIDKDVFTADPIGCYEKKIFSKSAPLKTAVIWNKTRIDENA